MPDELKLQTNARNIERYIVVPRSLLAKVALVSLPFALAAFAWLAAGEVDTNYSALLEQHVNNIDYSMQNDRRHTALAEHHINHLDFWAMPAKLRH
jgi:hypothetical protein